MDTHDGATKRLVAYCRHDKKTHSFDISKAQVWELKPQDSDWDPIECFPRQTTERTLYRLEGKQWVLVEQASHFEAGLLGDPTCVALTDAQAAEELALSGKEPPADIAHHVADKLAPPPIQPAVAETPEPKVTIESTEAEKLREMDVFGLLPPVKKFGPVRDGYSGDETTLFQYPHRWILFTDPSYQAAGKQYKPLTPFEATQWFLQNGLEVPKDLYEFLPGPSEQQTAGTRQPEGSEQAGSYQEPPNGQKYGPVMDEWGHETTLTYYSPCYWILHGHRGGQDYWRRPLKPAEAAEWLLDNGILMPPSLTLYLPLPSEGNASQPDVNGEKPADVSASKQDRTEGKNKCSEDYESAARKYVCENRHREGTANALTIRELAEVVGCSAGKATKLPAWRELMADREKTRDKSSPKAVSLTSKLEATIGERDERLQQLIEEHKADYEPSPLDADGDRRRNVKTYKRV